MKIYKFISFLVVVLIAGVGIYSYVSAQVNPTESIKTNTNSSTNITNPTTDFGQDVKKGKESTANDQEAIKNQKEAEVNEIGEAREEDEIDEVQEVEEAVEIPEAPEEPEAVESGESSDGSSEGTNLDKKLEKKGESSNEAGLDGDSSNGEGITD